MRLVTLAGFIAVAAATAARAQSPFAYDRSVSLNARILQRVDTATFVREKIAFDGGAGLRVPALVAVPKGGPARKPLILLVDGIGGWKERWWQATSWNRGRILIDSLLAAGFAVAMSDAPASGERTFENDFVSAESFIGDTVKWLDMGVKNAIDSRRLLDYLSTRPDIDTTRFGVLGLSHGGMMTFVLSEIEPRVKVAVSGLAPLQKIPAMLNPATHAARVRIPMLMFAATQDGWYTRPQVEAAFAAIGTSDKKLLWYEGGHRPPPDYAGDATRWFRDHLPPR